MPTAVENRRATNGSSPRWESELLRPDVILATLQLALLAVFQFGDIGFDHPGRFGLDFDHAVLIGISYAGALLLGIACSVVAGRWKWALLQVGVPLALAVYTLRTAPRYEARDYQFLLGRSTAEVDEILSTHGRGTAIVGHPDGDREWFQYNGMTVIFSPEGKVIEVVPEGN